MSDLSGSDEKLPKSEILRKREDFRNLFRSGRKYGTTYLRFVYTQASKRQAGFSVPKKLGNAVQRNRIKRLMREVYRKNKDRVGQYMFVMLARENAKSARFQDLKKDFVQFTENAGVSP